MAYGKGQNKDFIKRAVELGTLPMSPELSSLRSGILTALVAMAASIWPNDILQPIPHGRDIDAVMLKVQSDLSKRGLNSVWGEKARLLAKSAVLEQWKRAQRNLFGRFKNVGTVGDKPMAGGVKRLVNLPEAFSMTLTEGDIEKLQDLAANADFASMLELFRKLGCSNCGLTSPQTDALRAMLGAVRQRFACPAWNADAVIQLHLDYRCLRGRKAALSASLEALGNGVLTKTAVAVEVRLVSASPRCDSIVLPMQLCRQVAEHTSRHGSGQIRPTSLLVELGPDHVRPKMVVVRPPDSQSLDVAPSSPRTSASPTPQAPSYCEAEHLLARRRLHGSVATTAATGRR
jgi:hypothetical protein